MLRLCYHVLADYSGRYKHRALLLSGHFKPQPSSTFYMKFTWLAHRGKPRHYAQESMNTLARVNPYVFYTVWTVEAFKAFRTMDS